MAHKGRSKGRYTKPNLNARFFRSDSPSRNAQYFVGGSRSQGRRSRGGSGYSADRNPSGFNLSPAQIEQNKKYVNDFAKLRAQQKPFNPRTATISGNIAQGLVQEAGVANSLNPAQRFDRVLSTQSDFNNRARDAFYNAEIAKTATPGGWKNVVDVLSIAVNPFTDKRIEANVNGFGGRLLEAGANNPFTTAAFATGVVSLIRGTVSAVATAVQNWGRVGTVVPAWQAAGVGSVGGTAATAVSNTATKKATASYLTRMVRYAKSPRNVVGALLASIGSYPFAGFIKEEALQTLDFGVSSAVRNNDPDGAREAVEFIDEVLEPGLWDQILQSIPFANVVANLRDYYNAATIKNDINKRIVEDLIAKSNGLSDDEIDEFRQSQFIQDRLAIIEAQAAAQERYLRLKQQAEQDNLNAQARYWENQLKQREAFAAKEREASLLYWQEYYKLSAKYKEDSLRSNLKFGLL